MTPEKIKRLEAIVAQTLGLDTFSFVDFMENPGKYGGTVNDAALLKIQLEANADDDVITDIFSNVGGVNNADLPSNNEDPFGAGGFVGQGISVDDDDKREIVKRNSAGEIIFDAEGNPETVTVVDIFPAENFVETFIQTLNQSDVLAIQNYAIGKGYLDEEDLGSEINGNLGIVTENFIYEVLDYANKEYEDWYEGSPKRNAFIDKEAAMRQSFTIVPDINNFFGGIDYRTNQYNQNQIVSREIFANVLDEYLKVKVTENEDEQLKIDKQRAAEIRLENIKPTQLQVEEDLEEYWKTLTNDVLSDDRKEQLALGVMRNWSTYLDALEAQDKSLRAGEVMKKYTGPTISTMPEGTTEDGQYVMFEDIKPEFKVENPLLEARSELEEQAEAQNVLSGQAQQIADVQREYLTWLMGGK
jgi:hypothetical protein